MQDILIVKRKFIPCKTKEYTFNVNFIKRENIQNTTITSASKNITCYMMIMNAKIHKLNLKNNTNKQ